MQHVRSTAGLGAAALFALISAAAAGEPPVVRLVSASPWTNDETTVRYVLYDADDDVGGNLVYSLYFYPDANLQRVDDVRVFATRIASQEDLDPDIGTGDFTESAGIADVQSYTWGDPGLQLQNRGFAPAWAILPGTYYLYLLAHDHDNEAVMAVSDFSVTVTRDATAVRRRSWGRLKAER